MVEIDLKGWLVVRTEAARFVGKETGWGSDGFVRLQPAYEVMANYQVGPGATPKRAEFFMAVELLENSSIYIKPTSHTACKDFPAWRQKEIVRGIQMANEQAKAHALECDSGIILAR